MIVRIGDRWVNLDRSSDAAVVTDDKGKFSGIRVYFPFLDAGEDQNFVYFSGDEGRELMKILDQISDTNMRKLQPHYLPPPDQG